MSDLTLKELERLHECSSFGVTGKEAEMEYRMRTVEIALWNHFPGLAALIRQQNEALGAIDNWINGRGAVDNESYNALCDRAAGLLAAALSTGKALIGE